MEELSRKLLLTVKNNIADALVKIAADMEAEDVAFFGAMGQPVPATPLVVPAKYVVGHHPPILEETLSNFPSVAASCYLIEDEETEFDIDQAEVLPHIAYVEVLVVHEDIETIARIAWRYAKAVHSILLKDKSLGGTSLAIDRSPRTEVSMPVMTGYENDSDAQVYVQGAKVEHPFEIIGVWQ